MNEQLEQKLKERYGRTGGELGSNEQALARFIEMLRVCEDSVDERVQKIIESISTFEKLAPNFQIFESESLTAFMHTFRAFSIKPTEDMTIVQHEFGHTVLSVATDTKVPEDFEGIVARAKANSLSEQVKQDFIDYVIYISDPENKNRTIGEKDLVGDIISSIFQYPSLTFTKRNKRCVLPSYHDRDYYFDEEKGQMRTKNIFDEDFANFFALVANNCTKELEMLRFLFGDEWYQTMDDTLTKVSSILFAQKQLDEENFGSEQPKI